MASVKDIMDALGEAFPWELAPEGDRSGILVGSLKSVVTRVLCSIELNGVVVEHAIALGCELLVTHHNHILSLPTAPWDADTPAGALAGRAIEGGLSIVACHACADAAEGGTADLMAERLGLEVSGPLEPSKEAFWAKVVVFVPPEALEDVSAAMAEAGAGNIGDYRHCSFRVSGTGTFVPGERAEPYSGKGGVLNREEEVRLEMLAPSFNVPRVVEALLGKHPYEEPAYDVYRTEAAVPWGAGRMGTLGQERTCRAILGDLAAWSGSGRAALFGDPARRVTRAAVAPGAAGVLGRPAHRAGCELLIAGEMGWHETGEANEAGMSVICLGNVESERALVPAMVGLLERASERGFWGLDIEGYGQEEEHWG